MSPKARSGVYVPSLCGCYTVEQCWLWQELFTSWCMRHYCSTMVPSACFCFATQHNNAVSQHSLCWITKKYQCNSKHLKCNSTQCIWLVSILKCMELFIYVIFKHVYPLPKAPLLLEDCYTSFDPWHWWSWKFFTIGRRVVLLWPICTNNNLKWGCWVESYIAGLISWLLGKRQEVF